jgi:hypothetical protein
MYDRKIFMVISEGARIEMRDISPGELDMVSASWRNIFGKEKFLLIQSPGRTPDETEMEFIAKAILLSKFSKN